MRLIDADALAEEIKINMENGFPANEYLSLYAISCLAHAPTVDVLDKIKAEIEQAKTIEIKTGDTAFKVSADVVINPQYRNFTSGLDIALQIIDKYR